MYVTANSGLLIRADSNTNASKLGLAPYGAKVSVLEQSPKTMTIGGKTGHWTRIDFNGLQGWAFGGYLSATPPGPKQAAKPADTRTLAQRCSDLESCEYDCFLEFNETNPGQEVQCYRQCRVKHGDLDMGADCNIGGM